MPTPDIFLDTSALFAGIWSATGGARMLLKLGEAGAIRLLVSSQVLAEVENVLRRKSPESLGALALILDQSQIAITSTIESEHLTACHALISYPPDALILAAAWSAQVDYFVTLDRQHLLDNPELHTAVPFPIGTPGDCLHWYRAKLISPAK
jgi:predicted nucleic acid-binding protein